MIGKGLQQGVYDPAVHLPQLSAPIAAISPPIGKLLRAEMADVIKESEVPMGGLAGGYRALGEASSPGPDQVVLDRADARPQRQLADVHDLCWGATSPA